MLKNEIHLLKIKSENKKKTLNSKKHEIKDLNREYANKIEQIKKGFTNDESLINHYKGNIKELFLFIRTIK